MFTSYGVRNSANDSIRAEESELIPSEEQIGHAEARRITNDSNNCMTSGFVELITSSTEIASDEHEENSWRRLIHKAIVWGALGDNGEDDTRPS